MDYEGFNKWLVECKGISQRSTNDVLSRVRRVLRLCNMDRVTPNTMAALLNNETYHSASRFIKAQLKRAVALYCEYTAG